jgi:Rrf2 family protein
MRLGDGVEWALHCCTVLAVVPSDEALPAAKLAEFHGVPPAYLAKHLQALSRAGITDSVPGKRGGYRLARPAAEITLLDVVDAVEGTDPVFRCTEIRQRGPASLPVSEYRAACTITVAMRRAEAAYRAELRSQSVLDLVLALSEVIDPRAVEKAMAWMAESAR